MLKWRTRWDARVARQVSANVAIGPSSGLRYLLGMRIIALATPKAFVCRPLRQESGERMPVPEISRDVRVAYLPPMSGLVANETRLDQGAINVRLGEGRTAEVLRNLCYGILEDEDGDARWERLDERIYKLFGSHLDKPTYNALPQSSRP